MAQIFAEGVSPMSVGPGKNFLVSNTPLNEVIKISKNKEYEHFCVRNTP
jgi:hypothetical protein